MKFVTIFLSLIFFFLSCSTEESNHFYPINKKPLIQKAFVKLPLGAVKPSGWLKDQLKAQASGLTGNLEDFLPDLIHSAWKGGDGEKWERSPYYLDGLIPLAYLLGDSVLIRKTKPWIEWILASGHPNGWFGPEGNHDRWPLAIAGKVMRQYYEATRDPRALALLRNYFRYLHSNPPDWPDDSWRGVRAMENAVTGYWLYRQTKDLQILETIQSIFENSFDWSNYFFKFPWDSAAVANGSVPHNWKADGLTAHVVNVAMAVKYPGMWYQQSGNDRFKQAVYAALRNLEKNHGQVGGRFSGDEHLSGKRPTQGSELCSVVEFMFSLENLFEIFGDPLLADRLEVLAYNALPGTMTPDCWAHQYDQQANQVLVSVAERDWSSNGNTSNIYGLMPNYPCCLVNMHQGWPKFVEHMWMATQDNGLAAVAYGPSVVKAKVGNGVVAKISEKTKYPFDGDIRFEVETEKPAVFPVYFRIPSWAGGATLSVNESAPAKKSPGQMVQIKRRWETGDFVTLRIPMKIRSERRYHQSVALLRGPLYLSLRIGKEYERIRLSGKYITSIDYKGSTDWQIQPITPWNYGLILDEENLNNSVSVKRNPLQKYPFADIDDMVYSPEKGEYMPWQREAPLVVSVKGRQIPGWKMKHNSADDPPVSPVEITGKTETLQLVPYACARLRITEFPLLK